MTFLDRRVVAWATDCPRKVTVLLFTEKGQ